MTRRLILTVDEAADRLGYHPHYLRKLLRLGVIRGRKISSNAKAHWRVPLEEVERLAGGVGGRGEDQINQETSDKSAA